MSARTPVTYLVKRAYAPPTAADGERVLVDRLWPRGVSKEHAELDFWAKEATPSNELRSWFHEDREHRYDEFVRRYEAELDGDAQQKALAAIRALGEAGSASSGGGEGKGVVTLVTAATDVEHSHVPVLIKRLTD